MDSKLINYIEKSLVWYNTYDDMVSEGNFQDIDDIIFVVESASFYKKTDYGYEVSLELPDTARNIRSIIDDFDASDIYYKNEVVFFEGKFYKSLEDNNLYVPEDGDKWSLIGKSSEYKPLESTRLLSVKKSASTFWNDTTLTQGGETIVNIQTQYSPQYLSDGSRFKLKDSLGNSAVEAQYNTTLFEGLFHYDIIQTTQGDDEVLYIMDEEEVDDDGIGTFKVVVQEAGFIPYSGTIVLNSGVELNLPVTYSNSTELLEDETVHSGMKYNISKLTPSSFDLSTYLGPDTDSDGHYTPGFNYFQDNSTFVFEAKQTGVVGSNILENGRDLFGDKFPPYVEVLTPGTSVEVGKQYLLTNSIPGVDLKKYYGPNFEKNYNYLNDRDYVVVVAENSGVIGSNVLLNGKHLFGNSFPPYVQSLVPGLTIAPGGYYEIKKGVSPIGLNDISNLPNEDGSSITSYEGEVYPFESGTYGFYEIPVDSTDMLRDSNIRSRLGVSITGNIFPPSVTPLKPGEYATYNSYVMYTSETKLDSGRTPDNFFGKDYTTEIYRWTGTTEAFDEDTNFSLFSGSLSDSLTGVKPIPEVKELLGNTSYAQGDIVYFSENTPMGKYWTADFYWDGKTYTNSTFKTLEPVDTGSVDITNMGDKFEVSHLTEDATWPEYLTEIVLNTTTLTAGKVYVLSDQSISLSERFTFREGAVYRALENYGTFNELRKIFLKFAKYNQVDEEWDISRSIDKKDSGNIFPHYVWGVTSHSNVGVVLGTCVAITDTTNLGDMLEEDKASLVGEVFVGKGSQIIEADSDFRGYSQVFYPKSLNNVPFPGTE